MGKDSEKNLVGQPIFKQIMEKVPRAIFDKIVIEHKSDRYYKLFSSWDEFITLMFGILTRCDSAREICDGMAAMGGKLNHLGMDCAPAKSTFGDALRDRKCVIFEKVYFALLSYYSHILSDSRKEGVSFEHFYAFDSTAIRLFTEVLKVVGRNCKDDGKKKGGLKVHMLSDVHADVPKFARINETRQHDKNFLQYLTLSKGSMIVFDKAYNHYWQFAKWTKEGINFGEVRNFQLPTFKLQVNYSTKYFKRTDENVNTITPDIKIEISFSDFTKGIDPVYEWIKKQ